MSAPNRIYLQIGDDVNEEEIPDDNWYTNQITWCADSINDNDIEYIRIERYEEVRRIAAESKVIIEHIQKMLGVFTTTSALEIIQEMMNARVGCTCPIISDNQMGLNPKCPVHGHLVEGEKAVNLLQGLIDKAKGDCICPADGHSELCPVHKTQSALR